ncbi:Xylose isomerase-like TIM barrel [uncultured Roseburia sp.]|uniref:Sugar phosphate isomerase/epimerase n=1 Tax=Brotonthovivens ammoniilytica TaxID=2981725 RepID=A0ABT2TMI3_9FIRM|nr:TIM barrel protein [Brotonthovivens ammoniilytica]MCU6763435.1 sugar phosphate isomerase/epimerase [Brotonthovivens ammoniilytica]SCJ19139.1 Xylose isomerase-like TIM barrel [uncultured Roseburia sp.]
MEMKNNGLKYGVSLYSFANSFHTGKMNLEQCIKKAKDLGYRGFTIVAAQMCEEYPYAADAWLDRFAQMISDYDMDPVCWEGYLDFGMRSDRDLTPEEVIEFTKNDIIYARKAGFHMMKTQHSISPEIFQRMAPFCEKMDVKLCIEMHWPHHPKVEVWQKYFDIMEKSEGWLGVCPDTSIFQRYPHQLHINQALEDGFAPERMNQVLSMIRTGETKDRLLEFCNSSVETQYVNEFCPKFSESAGDLKDFIPMLKYAHMIHGKFYYLADDITDPCIPYEEIMPLIKEAGYEGYFIGEYEGHHYSIQEDDDMQLKRFHNLTRRLYENA